MKNRKMYNAEIERYRRQEARFDPNIQKERNRADFSHKRTNDDEEKKNRREEHYE